MAETLRREWPVDPLYVRCALAALLVTRVCPALNPLPWGAGLAASYVNDSGIADNPAVLFAEDFEGFSGSTISWSDIGAFDNVYGTLSITRDVAEVHEGAQSVEITHTGTGTHGADKELAGHDTLFVRYYIKFGPAFPGVHHAGMGVRGGPEGALFTNPTGTRPNGTNHFMCYFDHLSPLHSWGPPDNTTPPGYAYNYCYHMDQSSNYGDNILPSGLLNNTYPFSDDFVPRPNVVPELDRWTCCEIMVQCNTLDSANGRVALWIDGELVADHPGLRFRSVDAITSRFVSLSTYASEERPGRTLWYDDIVVATAYVGPMGSGAGVVPRLQSRPVPVTDCTITQHTLRGRQMVPSNHTAPGMHVLRVGAPGTASTHTGILDMR